MDRKEFERSFRQAAIAIGGAGITCNQFVLRFKVDVDEQALEDLQIALAKLQPKTTKSIAIAMQLVIQGYQCTGFDFEEGFYFSC